MVTLLSLFVVGSVAWLSGYRFGHRRGFAVGEVKGFKDGKFLGGHRDHS